MAHFNETIEGLVFENKLDWDVVQNVGCEICGAGSGNLCSSQRSQVARSHRVRYGSYKQINDIPPITDGLGIHWSQPDTADIVIDYDYALMTETTFRQLANYSRSQPTGVYLGKMWKSKYTDGWYFSWFGKDVRPNSCLTYSRKILIVTD